MWEWMECGHRAPQIDRQSALQTAEKENTDHILFNHAVKSIRWPIYVFNSVFNVKYLLEAVRLQVNEKIDEKTHY